MKITEIEYSEAHSTNLDLWLWVQFVFPKLVFNYFCPVYMIIYMFSISIKVRFIFKFRMVLELFYSKLGLSDTVCYLDCI